MIYAVMLIVLFAVKVNHGSDITGNGAAFNIVSRKAPIYSVVLGLEHGEAMLASSVTLPLILLAYFALQLRTHVDVHKNAVKGKVFHSSRYKRFSLAYDGILNVELITDGIVIITQYGNYKCLIGNKNEVRDEIMKRIEATRFLTNYNIAVGF